jgi:uncharacterized lipoprotein YddW (UPF0748 family)
MTRHASRRLTSRVLRLAAAALLGACARPSAPPPAPPVSPDTPPPVQREFRGVWLTTVGNMDWPSRPGLPADSQRAEMVAMLDRAAAMKLNAVIFQVRTAGDALYDSPIEPWSEYLTGTQGRPPEPFYDPLAFAVEEAHRRGLELHAWFNPYRARHPSAKGAAAATHLSSTHPHLVRTYGTHLWMDPGEDSVRALSTRVMLDVVRRYDVDGVHVDDYFYPYRENDASGAQIPFPDDSSYARYQRAGGRLGRDDWRRDNVDRFVEGLYRAVKREKPWVQVGVSPIGIWRPGHPRQICCYDPYQELYADSRKWLRSGWLDYFVPQIYRPIAHTNLSYPVLLGWWAGENVKGRHLWPGNFTSRVGNQRDGNWRTDELVGQVYVTRGQPGATGNVHFTMNVFMQNPDSLVERLANDAYREPALVPATPWLGGRAPSRPAVALAAGPRGGATVRMEPGAGAPPARWVVQSRFGDRWRTEILPGGAREHVVRPDSAAAPLRTVAVSGVDRLGNQGAPVTVQAP